MDTQTFIFIDTFILSEDTALYIMNKQCYR